MIKIGTLYKVNNKWNEYGFYSYDGKNVPIPNGDIITIIGIANEENKDGTRWAHYKMLHDNKILRVSELQISKYFVPIIIEE